MSEKPNENRRYFYWECQKTLRYLLKQVVLKPIRTSKVSRRIHIREGDFILTVNGTGHHFTLYNPGGSGWYVYCNDIKPVYKVFARAEKYLNSLRAEREIIQPILSQSIFDIIQETVFDFYEAIDDLGTTRGFGNVGIILTGPAGVGKTETMRWVKEISRDKYNRSIHKLSYVQLRELLEEGTPFNPEQSLILIDDIDIGLLRDRKITHNPLTSQFLTCLDGLDKCEGRVIIISTNEPVEDENGNPNIDPALVRPGRFDSTINFDYPTFDLISEFCVKRQMPLDALKFDGWSFARMDMFASKFKVAKHRYGTTANVFYEKFIHEMGETDPTVDAYREATEV